MRTWFVQMRTRALTLLLVFVSYPVPALYAVGAAAPPQLLVPHGQLGAPGAGIAPNVLLNLSLTFEDAGAAYREPYAAAVDYAGYFNPRLCYRYPMKGKGNAAEPELDPASGYFSPVKPTDGSHACGGNSFSGNFLNWATASTLDLLRAALTGGDRVIDERGRTVLQRAWLPDGAVNPDFYAHPQHFPRKSVTGAEAASLTPFGDAPLFIVSCRNRVLFSTTQKGRSCDAPRFGVSGRRLVSDKYFGEFNVRVSVCSGDDSASRPSLCRPYGAAFKPAGVIQLAGKRIRIGIMSYLAGAHAADPAAYGGALRAVLASADDETIAASGITRTGGAIAAINRFGRGDPARLGVYNAGEPGAELFYEALRYLQGRAPSGAGVDAVVDAGIPVLNARDDPLLASCQRNIVATIGHSAFNADRYLPGNTRTLFGDTARAPDNFVPSAMFDVMEASRRVGAMEADPARTFGNQAPRPDLLKLDTLDDGPGGRGSRYLAGAAYWAHVNPIRTDKPARVDSFSLELGAAPASGESALYLAAKYGAFHDRNADGNPFITTGNRRDSSEWSTDGAAPSHYHPAPGPHDIAGAVAAMFAGAGPQSTATAGPSAASRGKGSNFVVLTASDPDSGTGSLRRHALTVQLGGAATVAAQEAWDAGELLSGNPNASPPVPAAAPTARKVFTFAPQENGATIPFAWASLPAESRALLDVPGRAMPRDGKGELRTAWLRGERTHEVGRPGGLFRKRAGILGDIVHSTPLIVGPPAAGGDEARDRFSKQYRERATAIYVGANDGMLHAFSASDGTELFAYVPHVLMPDLAALASPAWQPRPYVDGSPGHGDALVGGAWASVLASGMGMGGRGLFALDISNPGAFDKGRGALWEFTEHDDPAVGYLREAPQIVKLDVGNNGGPPVYRYFVLAPGGMNSLSGEQAMFLLALDKPPAQKWRHGANYHRLTIPPGDGAPANKLSAPGLVLAADGSVKHAYAGDLHGNLWRFDFASGGVHRMFTARDRTGNSQPIAHAPKVVFAPGGGYLVMFGTGKFVEHADTEPKSFTTQSMYAIHDRMLTVPVAVTSRAQLAPRTLAGNGAYSITGEAIDYYAPNAKRGWYFDFPNTRHDGERAAGSAQSVAGAIVFNTLLPGADQCTPPSGRQYVIDAVSGLALNAAGVARSGEVTGEVALSAGLAPPLLLDLGTTAGQRDATGAATATRSFTLLRPRPGGAATGKTLKTSFPAKRLGWREVSNWQELHEAAAKK